GEEEEHKGVPFVGASGMELNKMLHEAGIARSECFVTNVARERPANNDINNFIAKAKKDITAEHVPIRDKWVRRPIADGIEMLRKEIQMVSPRVIIALGNTPLWALTGHTGIMDWRGSMLQEDLTSQRVKVVPTYHPAAVLRQWSWCATSVHDLRKA